MVHLLVYIIPHYLNFLKDVSILTLYIPLDTLILNSYHEMEKIIPWYIADQVLYGSVSHDLVMVFQIFVEDI
jgi:hypothetical protein